MKSSDEEKRKSTRDTLNETESIAIEEAEEVGSRSSGEEEEEDEEDEEGGGRRRHPSRKHKRR